ncbi:MAG TPA: methyltransferase domain-containing protein [Pseudonocardiaceae bacterium]
MSHQHTPDIDFAAHAEELVRGGRVRSEVTARIAAELPLPPHAVAADVGCGAGEMTLLLAGRGATVYAVDREDALLRLVGDRAAELGHGAVRTVRAELADLPGVLPEPVDLVWAGHVVHHAGDQAAAVAGLAAALRPGGLLAVAEGGMPARSLPADVGVGEHGLEGRLDVAHDRWFAAMRAGLPGSVRETRGWPELLRAAGLVDVTMRAYLLQRPSPLADADREFVLHRLAGRVERAADRLDAADADAWGRLLDPADAAWLGHRRDLELLSVEAVYVGRRPN